MNPKIVPFASFLLGTALTLPGQTNASWGTQSPSQLSVVVYGAENDTVPAAPPAGNGVIDSPASKAPWAKLLYGKPEGSVTLLLAHMMPDPSELPRAEDRIALQTLYPFLGLPTGSWRADAQEFSSQTWDFDNPQSQEVCIPPVRMRAHILKALGVPTANLLDFGPHPTGYAQHTTFSHPATAVSPSNLDERFYFSNSWYFSRSVFDLRQVSPRALDVAAFAHYNLTNIPSPGRLSALIAGSYKWVLQIQAVHVTPPPVNGGRARIKLSNPIKVRRMTSGGNNDDQWTQVVGARRVVPSMHSDDWMSVGAKGHFTEVDLPAAISNPADVFCHFPLAGGGLATSQRVLVMGGTNLVQIKPTTCVFLVPTNAVGGIIYVTRGSPTGVTISNPAPNTGGYGAWFWPYEPLPQ